MSGEEIMSKRKLRTVSIRQTDKGYVATLWLDRSKDKWLLATTGHSTDEALGRLIQAGPSFIGIELICIDIEQEDE